MTSNLLPRRRTPSDDRALPLFPRELLWNWSQFVSDHTYKSLIVRAITTRIWNADFHNGSHNEPVKSRNRDEVIASVGVSDLSGSEQRLSTNTTLRVHPWSQEVAVWRLSNLVYADPPLEE